MSLDEKFDKVMARYDELRDTLAAGLTESGDFARLSKEYADLTPIAEAIAELKKGRAEAADLAEMIAAPDADPEMKAMAEEEFHVLTKRIPELERKVQISLLPKDEADEKNAILEVRAGTGGDEAALFAAELFEMYRRYAGLRGWRFEAMDVSETGIGGYKEATANITGRGVFARLKFESEPGVTLGARTEPFEEVFVCVRRVELHQPHGLVPRDVASDVAGKVRLPGPRRAVDDHLVAALEYRDEPVEPGLIEMHFRGKLRGGALQRRGGAQR